MPDFPSLNFRNVPFYFMSLFGILFILSLMDLIKVKNEGAIIIISFINIFISVSGWVCQQIQYSAYIKDSNLGDHWYLNWETGISGIVLILVFFTTLIGLAVSI